MQSEPSEKTSQQRTSTGIIGLDIGGTKTAILEAQVETGKLDSTSEVESNFPILQRREILTYAQDAFPITFERICVEIDAVLAEARRNGRTLSALSVSIGGPLKIEEGIILRTNHLPNWENVRLKDVLSERYGLPCYVEHDGNAGALAEFYFGAGRGAQNVIFLTAGTGLGAGLIFNGKIYRGTTDAAGEVGHIRIAEDGPVEYAKAGSWEGYASGSGLVKLAKLRKPGRWPETLTTRDLIQQALAGDADALAVVHESGVNLGKGLAVLIDVLNPEVIVLGSLAVALGDLWLGPAREVVQREAIDILAEACRIVPSELGPKIGDVAALMAAYARLTS